MFIRNTTRIELWKMLNLFWSNDFGRVCVSGKGIELSLWEMVSRVTCIVSSRALHGIVVSCRELLLGSLGNWIPMREQPESGAKLSENKETERRLWGIFLTFPRILDSYTKCRNYNIPAWSIYYQSGIHVYQEMLNLKWRNVKLRRCAV